MKKLFTLVALLACFLGANAQQQWEEVYSIDYSTLQGFPFYVMGYVPEFDQGYMTDHGANYKYAEKKDDSEETSDVIVKTQGGTEYYRWTEGGGWHQYFIADNIPTVIDESYKVVAMVKASEAVTFGVNMGWGWGDGQSMGASVSIPQSDEFTEVTWEYSGIGGSSCNLVAQPGGATATIDWQSLKVYHKLKANQRPKEWIEAITFNADAESAWPAWSLEETDGVNINWRGDRTGEICAWALTMGRNFQESVINTDSPRARPFPADIVADETKEGNHVFVVDAAQVAPVSDDDAGSVAWANQFWIQSPRGWTSGTQIKLHFRYKADHACTVGTQIHKQHPSDYLHWQAVGDISFTDQWQEFDKTITFDDSQSTGWSVAFNLNSDADNGRTANKFYFDDFSWQYLKLDEGYFISGIDQNKATSYDDLDNAVQFVEDDSHPDGSTYLVATVGEAGNAASYVDQIMISTVRGDDAAFKGATLKTKNKIQNDDEDWNDYTPATNTRLDLPGLGVWKVYIDTKYSAMAFKMLEGEEYEEIEIIPNATEVVVNGQEREPTAAEQPADEEAGTPAGTGAAWDNQFFIVANRALKAGEKTVLQFKYKASTAAKTTTQCHGAPGAYMHWGCIGDVNFTEEWQDYEKEYTIPSEADGMKSIAFNMAEIKDACVYELKEFVWMSGKEWLIDQEGAKNFWVKEGAGTTPHMFGAKEHDITAAEAVNGTVEVSKKAYELQTITITATPAEGFAVDAVTVTCATIDQIVEVKEAGENKFSFEMPDDDVTVTVTFKDASGINSIVAGKTKSAVIYNLAGQRVSKDFKGIVVKDGRKAVLK